MKNEAFQLNKPKTIHDIAREFLDDAGGITSVAIERLQQLIREDEALRIAIAADAVMAFAAQHIEKKMREDRAAIWTRAAQKGEVTKPKTSVAALANGIRESILNFPLAGGIRLRDATREQVEEQAQRYAAASRDMGHKARWLSAIAQRVEPGQTVGECLSEDDALALHREAQE